MDSSFFVNNVLVPFSASLAGNVGGNALKPIFKMLDNWFYITFGSDLDFEVKKKKLEQAHRLELYEVELNKVQNIGEFQKDVVDLLNDIDYSDLVIPDKKTLAQIMSVLPIYLDIDDTRLLLAKVLTASCDRSRKDFVHPSIIEIIKQLTSYDIKLIRRLYRSLGFAASVRMRPAAKMDDPTDFCPISINGQEIPKRLYFTVREGGFDIKNGPLWINSEDIFIEDHLSDMPIYVLKRLGIIDEIEYENYEEKSIVRVQDFVENAVSEMKSEDDIKQYVQRLKVAFGEIELDMDIKIIQLTNFGERLCHIMFPEIVVPITMTVEDDGPEFGIDAVE